MEQGGHGLKNGSKNAATGDVDLQRAGRFYQNTPIIRSKTPLFTPVFRLKTRLF
jgi:hypothetical protein